MATQIVEMTGDEAKLFKSLDRLIQKEADHRKALEKVGNEGAEAGRKMEGAADRVGKANERTSKKSSENWRKFSDDSAGSFDGFATKAIASIGGVVGAYVGISEGIQAANEFLQAQNRLYDESLEKQTELAKAQQETFKNLAGLAGADRVGLIEQAPEIARRTGFSDIGAIIEATGAAVSAGGDRAAAESAVSAAALLTINTPEAIDELAAAAIDLRRATGSQDARENLGLLTLAGTQARVVDPVALAETISPALVSAVSTVPLQDQGEASRQAASLFAAFGRQTADPTGKATSTATTQFVAELGKFFGDLEEQRRDARSKITVLDRSKKPLTESQVAERQRLTGFLEQTEGFADPKTLFGRIEALQDNEAIRGQFFSREFGEVRFKDAFKQITDGSGALAKELKDSFDTIQLSKEAFENQVADISGRTATLRIAGLSSAFQAESAAAKTGNTIGALRGLVRQEAARVLEETRGGGITGFAESTLREFGVRDGTFLSANLDGDSVAAEAFTALDKAIGRQRFLRIGGITKEEEQGVEQAAGAIDLFRRSIIEAVRLDPTSLDELQRGLTLNADLGANPLLRNDDGELREVSRLRFFQQIFSEATAVAKETLEEQKKIRQELEAAREANERSAEANEATAANTTPRTPTPPNYGNHQRGRQ